jgi:aryl-alcohol dehydrogenase-like predicted oxidoreductase
MTGISTVTVGWSPLGGGLLTGKYRRGEMGRAESFKRLVHAESDAVKSAVLDVVLAVAEEAGGSPAGLHWPGC